MGQIACGMGKLRVNGIQLPIADEMRIMASNVKREALMGLDGSLAMQDAPQACWIEASIRDTPDIALEDMFVATGVTVIAELSNGTSYELSEAFYSGDSELDVKDGKVSGRWTGKTIRRLTP